ncbi:MAG: ABC transporter substrate-binding protein [Anaerolineaceae bacterium]
MTLKKTTRREFLFLSATGIAGAVLAACAAPTATTAPGAPAATAVPATAVPAATQAAVATPTPIPTEAATATSVAAAAAAHESPLLAAQVAAGKLPPLEQRLPKVPLTLSPVDGIGKYGGRMRSFISSPGTYYGHWQESQYGHSALRWIDDGLGIAPGMCDTWSANADNSVWTVHVREGLKWSDGQPCTVDDIMFWWEDLTLATDPSHPDGVPDFGTDANGKLAVFTKVDDYTLTIGYGTPSPLTAKRLAMWVNANIGPRWIAPKHYLSQFHPKYNTAEKDFKDFNTKAETWTNPDCPVLNHFILTKYDAGKSQSGDRNPYYYAVDTQGNQLPYLDGWDCTVAADRETELLFARQGSVDEQHFSNYTLGDIATLKDGQDAGNYDVYLWDSGSGTAMMYFWNYDAKDDKLRALYRTPAFKQAMSFALDRPTIQQTVYYGTGILTTGTMSPKAFEFNFNADAQAFGKKARDIYSAYDPAKAATMLDAIGCKKGTDGFRTYPDGSKLEVRVDLQADANKECTDVLEIATKDWQAVGLNVIVNQVTPTAFDTQWWAGTLTFRTNWEVGDGPDHLLYPSWVVPNENTRWAPLCGQVLALAGTPTEAIDTDKSPWDRKPPRFIPTDKDYVGTPIEQIHKLYATAIIEPDQVKRASIVWQMWQIHEDSGPFFIGTVANYPKPKIVSRKMTNVPTHDQLKLGGFDNPWIIPYPAVTDPETWSFK